MARLYRVTIPVSDLDRAARFFEGLLGYPGERVSHDWHYVACGETTLACQRVTQGQSGGPHSQPIYLALDENLIHVQGRAAMYGAMRVDPEIGTLTSGERGFRLRDPFGNAFCIVEAATAGRRPAAAAPAASASVPASRKAASIEVLPMEREFINAVKGGELGRVTELLAMDPDLVKATDGAGVSVLLLAAYKRNARVADHLLSVHHSLNIWEAAAFGQIDPLLELLKKDPLCVGRHSVDGFTPLGLACYFGRLECVRLLLAHHADANVPSRNAMQVRPLHSALSHSEPRTALAIVRELLQARADVNATEQGGYTPLHRACDRGDVELVKALLAAGAHLHIAAANGRTPRDLARARNHREVLEALNAALHGELSAGRSGATQ